MNQAVSKGDIRSKQTLEELANGTSPSRREAEFALMYVALMELRETVSSSVKDAEVKRLLKDALGGGVTSRDDAVAIEILAKQSGARAAQARLAAGYLNALREWKKRVK